ncbi:MAG TPA: lysyl oxidase family protein [Bacteroidota bacterium]|jgi:hypothetical protein|nr:lysyl oxidase family protein [Bacteroidota bacterium]
MNNYKALYIAFAGIILIVLAFMQWDCSTEPPTPIAPSTGTKIGTQPPTETPVTVTTAYPDITIDSARLAGSIKFSGKVFKPTDCAVVESCIVSGKRRIMRFDVATPNLGTADVILGDPAAHPDWFVYSPCHGHYHLRGFSEYRLRNTTGVVVTGHKQAFCLMDVAQYWKGYPSQGYTCSNQGISVGWGDVYGSYLDCQWLDVTGVPPGKYFIEVVINRSGFINEGANVYPDSIDVPVTISK